jgi:hypothetical protein
MAPVILVSGIFGRINLILPEWLGPPSSNIMTNYAECPTCKKQFVKSRPWSKFCAPKCRHNAPDKKLVTRAFQQSRRDLVNKIKVDRGCAKCGYSVHAAALDFNHVRGDKKFNVSQDTKVALQKLLDEIAKCEVLCANCHRIHTYENRHWHTNRK